MAKASRELQRKLERLEYERLDALTGSGHLIYRHPRAGTLIVPATPSDHRSELNVLAQARRMIRLLDSEVGAFLTYMRLTYNVPRRGHKDFALRLSTEVQDWMRREKVRGITASGITQGVTKSPFYENLGGTRGSTSRFRLYGRDYAFEQVPEPIGEVPIRTHRDEPDQQANQALVTANGSRPSSAELLDRVLAANYERRELLALTLDQAEADYQELIQAHQELGQRIETWHARIREAQAFAAAPLTDQEEVTP